MDCCIMVAMGHKKTDHLLNDLSVDVVRELIIVATKPFLRLIVVE